ncbi:hypothetical protein PAMP_004137 [Pampus punctatissimus]
MSKNSISTEQELRKGESLVSVSGKHTAVFQEDGNFVIYTEGHPIWSSKTDGSCASRIILQRDNNLVMYSHEGPIWATDTWTPDRASTRMRLTLTNEGQLVLERDGEVIWKSREV